MNSIKITGFVQTDPKTIRNGGREAVVMPVKAYRDPDPKTGYARCDRFACYIEDDKGREYVLDKIKTGSVVTVIGEFRPRLKQKKDGRWHYDLRIWADYVKEEYIGKVHKKGDGSYEID